MVVKVDKFPDEHLTLIKKSVEKYYKDFCLSGTASFLVTYPDGKTEKDHYGGCHASLSRFSKGSVGGFSSFQSGYTEYNVINDTYYDYLCKRSHFSPACVEWDKKGFYFRSDVPSNILSGFLVATRVCWEKPSVPVMFKKLVDNGLDEHKAFVVSFLLAEDSKGIYYIGYNGHTPFAPPYVETFFRYSEGNFYKGQLNPNYDLDTCYTGMDRLWWNGIGRIDWRDVLTKTYEEFHKREIVEEKVNYNPFAEALKLYEKSLESRQYKKTFRVPSSNIKKVVEFFANVTPGHLGEKDYV